MNQLIRSLARFVAPGRQRAQAAVEDVERTSLLRCFNTLLEDLPETAPTLRTIEAYATLSTAERRRQLPQLFRVLEGAVATAYESETSTLPSRLAAAHETWPTVFARQDLAWLFERPEDREIALCRAFLCDLLDETIATVGRGQGAMLSEAAAWLSAAPSRATLPIPFCGGTAIPASPAEWCNLLEQMGQALFDVIGAGMGDALAERLFSRCYDRYAERYAATKSFAALIALLPDPLLDGEKISLVQHEQAHSLLVEKITELKAANEEIRQLNETLERRVDERTRGLRKSELQFRQLVESYPSGVYVQSRGQIVFANDAVAKQVGAGSVQELIGRESLSLYHPDDRSRVQEYRGRITKLGQTGAFHVYRGLRLDGSAYDLEGIATGIEWEGVPALLVVVRDVTEQQTMERSLAEARDRAEQSARAKSEFLANMSHEIRTPMNGVLGMAELLGDTALDTQQRHFVDTIRSSGTSLLAVINDILDYSKIEAGKLRLETVAFDLPALTSGIGDLFELSAREKAVEIRTFVPESVPRVVRSDPNRLRQILSNLVNNAIKFSEDGGAVHIRVAAADVGPRRATFAFAVEDTGIGIEADKVERLFSPFEQGDSSMSRRFGGTGLGLAIVHELAELMGGAIVVESTVGEGSTFTITLTLDIADANELEDADARSHAGNMVKFDASVLLVEDNLVNLELAEASLTDFGCAVTCATNGAEGVEAWRAGSFDLILMDCQMPTMDGFEATAHIRAAEAAHGDGVHIPIVALTAHVLEEHRDQCLAAGMDDYLSKPFDRESLSAMLRKWLTERQPTTTPPSTRLRGAA